MGAMDHIELWAIFETAPDNLTVGQLETLSNDLLTITAEPLALDAARRFTVTHLMQRFYAAKARERRAALMGEVLALAHTWLAATNQDRPDVELLEAECFDGPQWRLCSAAGTIGLKATLEEGKTLLITRLKALNVEI